MRILHVIHGFPPAYNAGSEVYTQAVVHSQADRHEIHVFTREEDVAVTDGRLRVTDDELDPRVRLHVVNVARARDRYRNDAVDQAFASVLDEVCPDVVHVGHLNHLSTSIVREVAVRGIPLVHTLHDFWLMCPRGQFVRMEGKEPWSLCAGQDDRTCATECYQRYFTGGAEDHDADAAHWTGWIGRRMRHVREMCELVDRFLVPSRTVLDRFRDDFDVPAAKLQYLPYGFDRERLTGRRRVKAEPFTFGYIGTHIPQKGVAQLVDAFGSVPSPTRLRIWGRDGGHMTAGLRRLAKSLPGDAPSRIEWCGEYRNQDIIQAVFDRVDAIVVPSLWLENAPLVIHEAQQARVPVVTADAGGMAELVQNGINGRLFRHRSIEDLAARMRELASAPDEARRLGARGHLATPEGDVPSVHDHVSALDEIYAAVIARRASAAVEHRSGPWRITFDTNPDDCNLHCIMCEEHSPHSDLQTIRRSNQRSPRRMDVAIIRRIVRQAKPQGLREIIPSTMGEPLLYAGFEEILAVCREEGVALNLTTNGTFPRLGARAWAEKIVPVGSDVKISWNGATAATHESIMLGSRFEKALENLRAFIEVRDIHAAAGGNRCRVTLQLTFLESNIHELADVVRLAAKFGVDRVKGHHLWAHFDEIRALSMRRSPKAIERWNAAVAAATEAADTHRLPDGSRVLLENIHPLDTGGTEDIAPGGCCPFLGQEAWVSAEGRFDPCCAPDAQRRTLGEFGNLHEQGVMEIWDSDRYRELVQTYRNRALCIGCNMRRPAQVTS